MHEGYSSFVQTVISDDIVAPEFARRLHGVSQTYIATIEELDRELTDRRRMLRHMQAVQTRYATWCRRRTEVAVAEAVRDRLRVLEEHERQVREAAQAEAEALNSATCLAACDAVESTLCDTIEIALTRIMERVEPRERIAGIVRAALREANLRTPAVLRIGAVDKTEVIAAIEAGLGDGWQEIITLEINPLMESGSMELTTSNGTQMIAQRHQMDSLMAALRSAVKSAESDATQVLSA